MIYLDSDQLIAIGIFVGIFIAVILINTIVLKMGIKAVKGEETSLGRVFLTSLLLIFVSGIFSAVFAIVFPNLTLIGSILSLIIDLFIIKGRHHTTFLGALGALIIYTIVLVVVIIVLIFFFTTILSTFLAIFGLTLPTI